MKVAVLISGGGTNLQALIDACQDSGYPAEIAAVISNKAGVKGLERAEKAGIPTTVISHKDYDGREAFDTALDAAIKDSGAELVCLAGFLRILTDGFVNSWAGKMINIHPSLLPSFKGLDVQQAAIDAGVKFSGCTVHYVVPEMDAGPIIAQAVVPISPDDDASTLAARILVQEHKIYPLALKLIAEGRVSIDGNHVVIENFEAADGALINPTQ